MPQNAFYSDHHERVPINSLGVAKQVPEFRESDNCHLKKKTVICDLTFVRLIRVVIPGRHLEDT